MFLTQWNKIADAECDIHNRLKLSFAMRRLQAAGSEQLEAMGIPGEKLFHEGMAFLLSKMCLLIHRMPEAGETVQIATAPAAPKGARFVRLYNMQTPAGETLLSGYSLWVLADSRTHKIMRPSAFPYSLPMVEPKVVKAVDFKIPPEEGTTQNTLEIQVGYSHLDCNRHVNNCMYADYICDALPFEVLEHGNITQAVLEFRSEACKGDCLSVTANHLTQGRYRVSGNHARGICFDSYVLVEEKKDRLTVV